MLVVRSGGGEAKYVFSSAAQYIGTFGNLADAPVTNSTKMRAALKQWIGDAAASPGHNMSRYLEWKAGAEGPVATPAAEFPFTVNADIPRATYEDLRKQKAPVFCFVQGIESERCLVLGKDGSVAEVGIQSFPG